MRCMNRVGKAGLVLAALSLLAAADTTSPDVVMQRMQRAQAELVSLSAAITQIKSYPQLGFDDPAERGIFLLKRNHKGDTRVRMEIREPEIRILSVGEGKYLMYQPRIKQALEGDVSGAGSKTSLFSGILSGSAGAREQLASEYEVAGLGIELTKAGEAFHLRFAARKGAEVFCQRIDLWVSSSSWLPVQQACLEANRSEVTFTLEAIEVNPPLEDDAFEVSLPDDVEKLRG